MWDASTAEEAGFDILDDVREQPADNRIGGAARRKLVLQSNRPGTRMLQLSERRPFLRRDESLNVLNLKVALSGKEDGLPRFQRPEVEPEQEPVELH